MRLGVHCSLRNGLTGALEEGKSKGCETIQIFTRSPRVWKMKPHPGEEIAAFVSLKTKLKISPVIVHAPYLPNLATSIKELYDLSTNLLIEDLAISEKIAAEYLVIHPGSYSEGSSQPEGIANIARAISQAFETVAGKTMILLENVAGGGRRIGSSFEELRAIIDTVSDKNRVGICFDTAHAYAAGFDIADKKGLENTMLSFDRIIGLHRLKVMHLNDSLVPFASKKDRHEHIGKGTIGLPGFKNLLQAFNPYAHAGILETPKTPEDADIKNLQLLFSFREERTQKNA